MASPQQRRAGYRTPAQQEVLDRLLRWQREGYVLRHCEQPPTWWMDRGQEYHCVHAMVALGLKGRHQLEPFWTDQPGPASYRILPRPKRAPCHSPT